MEKMNDSGARLCKRDSERGVALIAALLGTFLVLLLGLAVTTGGIMTLSISKNERQATEAFYFADSGIARAQRLLLPKVVDSFSVFLTAGNGQACDGDELPIVNENYRVRVCDDDESKLVPPDNDPNQDTNGRIRVISTGIGQDGATATIEVIIEAGTLPALLVDGNLRLNGNPDITGQGGAAHANGNLDLTGNPRAEQFFTSTGKLTVSGGPRTGSPPYFADTPPQASGGEGYIDIPELKPGEFRDKADYVLGNDGLIRDAAGSVVGPNDGKWKDWKWDQGGQRWVAGQEIPPGTYYAEGNIEISGNPGEGKQPLPLTLIAEGWIDFSGNPNITPDLQSGRTRYAAIAGTDLRISGNPNSPLEGVFYATDQVDFSGNPYINGQVIAANKADLPFGGKNKVELSSGFMGISGNPTIHYDVDGLVIPKILAWRECRGPDPTNPCNP